MNVFAPVDPGPLPGCVVDNHHVRVPIKAAIPPAPRAKEFSDSYEEVKPDRVHYHDAGLRREENNRRVVVDITWRIRPDWQIDTPEMRAAWEKGEKKRFFPYGKSMKEILVRASNALDQFLKAAEDDPC
jgi:hypothetical protein